MKRYRTIDLLHRAYNGEHFDKKFRNVNTGEIISQGNKHSDFIDQSQHFFTTGEGNFCPCDFKTPLDFEKWLNQQWEEVQEPVSFIEAVNSGKRIRYEVWDSDEYSNIIDVIKELGEDFRSEDTIRKMIIGKWYIEED